MAPRKRVAEQPEPSAAQDDHDQDHDQDHQPVAKRRSSRRTAAVAAVAASSALPPPPPPASRPGGQGLTASEKKKTPTAKKSTSAKVAKESKATAGKQSKASASAAKPKKEEEAGDPKSTAAATTKARGSSPDPDPEDIPVHNPECVQHDGKWYWLMKAEPETRMENGHDVRFSIDDLRACTKPEGWDGIRAYVARNNLKAMNAGDMAFFYHSNCKTPGIVGTMEIVREFSEDKSARRPGTPYYDPKSTKDNPRWSLVHVEFRRKFAVPIYLPELRELGKPGGPLAEMQMLKQSRISVSKVGGSEWEALCKLADEKAKEAGLEHEDA